MRFASSSRFDRNPISTRTDGISGAFNTANPAKRWPRLSPPGISLISCRIFQQNVSTGSLTHAETCAAIHLPPLDPRHPDPVRQSGQPCSHYASAAASLSEAVSDRVKKRTCPALILKPLNPGMQRDKQISILRPSQFDTLAQFEISVIPARQHRPDLSGSSGSWRASSMAAASVTSFSFVPARPMAPGSLPPCPASMKTTQRFGRFCGFGTAIAEVTVASAFACFGFGMGGVIAEATIFVSAPTARWSFSVQLPRIDRLAVAQCRSCHLEGRPAIIRHIDDKAVSALVWRQGKGPKWCSW